jgi:D-glycero-alpha-D-manno-heptose-7-phosphate kinase
VVVDRLRLAPSVARELEASLALCFSGEARASAGIISEQSRNIGADNAALAAMHELKDSVGTMRDALLDGDLAAFAVGLDRSWQAKKATASGIVTPATEALEGLARAAGAMAVKVSGAGGGGFVMCVVQPERRARLIGALQAAGHPTDPVHLTEAGSEAWLLHRPTRVFPGPGKEPADPQPGLRPWVRPQMAEAAGSARDRV